MQEAEILAATRQALANFGIASTAEPVGEYVLAIGIGNGKIVSTKITGTDQIETSEQITARGADLAQKISAQMAGL